MIDYSCRDREGLDEEEDRESAGQLGQAEGDDEQDEGVAVAIGQRRRRQHGRWDQLAADFGLEISDQSYVKGSYDRIVQPLQMNRKLPVLRLWVIIYYRK